MSERRERAQDGDGAPMHGSRGGDTVERLDFAERWMADGFAAVPATQGVLLLDVDMTRARALLEVMRGRGVRASYTHLFVRAAALALTRHPELRALVAGGRRLRSARVDVGLSVAGATSYAPVLVLVDAGAKSLGALVEETARRVPEVRAEEARNLARLRRWGWIVPLGALRRWLLRALYRSLGVRRRAFGTLQVTAMAEVDVVLPLVFLTAGCLGVGRVRDRVVAVDGAPAVRAVVTITCAFDHKVWDGRAAGRLLGEIRRILEGDELAGEAALAPEPAPAG